MRDMNRVFLMGRLGKDPTRRETKAGTTVVHFPLATSRRVRSESDSEDGAQNASASEETQWHQIVAWGKEAQHCADYLSKGQAVFVEGSVRTRKFESKDGTQRTAFEVHADRVNFLGLGGGSSRERDTLRDAG